MIFINKVIDKKAFFQSRVHRSFTGGPAQVIKLRPDLGLLNCSLGRAGPLLRCAAAPLSPLLSPLRSLASLFRNLAFS